MNSRGKVQDTTRNERKSAPIERKIFIIIIIIILIKNRYVF